MVAHPDDEILWFNPSYFDKIFIFFSDRHDRPEMKAARLRAISEHPLRDKIELMGITEPGLFKNKTRTHEYAIAYETVLRAMETIKQTNKITELFTHNKQGEYGHDDHVLLHNAAHDVFAPDQVAIWCPMKFIKFKFLFKWNKVTREIENDIPLFKKIRAIYVKHHAWTWNHRFLPKRSESYYLASGNKFYYYP